jgi:hypothetical protein
MVAERRSHLRYLEKKDKTRHDSLVKRLAIGREGKKEKASKEKAKK